MEKDYKHLLDRLIRDNSLYFSLTKEDIEYNDGYIFTVFDQGIPIIKYKDEQKIKRYLIDTLQLPEVVFGDNAQEIIEIIIDETNTLERDINYIYPVAYVKHPLLLIRNGIFPTSIDITAKWFNDYVNGTDIPTLDFWYQNAGAAIDLLHKESRWMCRSLESWKKEAIATGASIGLNIFGDRFIYNRSKRPINSMDMFRTPISFTYSKEDIIGDKILIGNDDWNYVPVTRYASGMSRGLYYSKKSTLKNYCGTFFYNEPESTTLLAYKTVHKSYNKYTACNDLYPLLLQKNKKLASAVYDKIQDLTDSSYMPQLELYINGTIPQDLMLTPSELIELYETSNIEIYYTDNKIKALSKIIPNVKHYAVDRLYLYAAEDSLDQALCLMGKALDIDIIILTNMIGSFQVVTEILDTRTREDSLRSLVFLK